MNALWYFDGTNLFNVLCPHKFKRFKTSNVDHFHFYNKRDYIYFEEDNANKVFLIDKGKVKIGYYTENGEEVVKAILTRGEIFGEKAILGVETRNEFAQSMDSKTSVCPVPVATMHELMRDNQTFSLKIYKFLGLRIKKLERRLQLLLYKDTRTRLVEFLGELCEEYGYDCEKTGNKVIKHPYTQKDIASLIGTSRPTLNTLLNQLKEEQLIKFDRKEIRFLRELA